MKSQTQKILTHLKSGKTLTAMQALKKFDCMRLAARIEDLREAYIITTEMIKRNGKRYARYKLVN